MVDDSLAREQASDPHRSVLLQAPAGSGKTTVLTERLLRLLAEVDQPEEILAITFTRKAAAEMRARVLKALRGELDSSTAQGARTLTLAQRALTRAHERGWDLQQDPGRLRIQTIDSFNFRLATQLTVTARAGGALSISERADELYHRAARQTLAAAEHNETLAADVELLFERLDNNWSLVQRLLAEMLNLRGHWLRYVLAQDPDALCERVSESLTSIVQEHLQAIVEHLPASLRARAGALPGVGELSVQVPALGAWQKLVGLTLTDKGTWRKQVNKTLGPAFEDPANRSMLKSLIEDLAGVPGFREAILELACLPPAILMGADAAAIRSLSRVLRSAAGHLQLVFSATGRVDHTYVAGAAREALTDAGLPTDLALRIGLSLRHILVDEFQDTSLAQFDLIEMLTAGWEAGDGRTLFVVGDPMQSIYQFREAEVGLFLKARDEGIGTVRLESLQLTRNFRSTPPLIDWINQAFQLMFPARDDLRASAVSFTQSVAGKAATPDAAHPVGVRLYDFNNRDQETQAVVERIEVLRTQDAKASIAVLVASRAHAAAIMTRLETRQVECVGVDLVPLRELSIVRDLVALIQASGHLADRTAWLTLLRAPWCGVSLASLSVLSQRRDRLLVWEALADDARLSQCAASDLPRLERLRDILTAALPARSSMPLADWLELTWLRLGAADAYPAAELRHARAFMTALSERVSAGEWSGPQDLDSLLADLFAQPQASVCNPVQLMTIHRAKGLEFDHVFLPCLDRMLNRGREPLLRWLDLPRAEGQSDLIMAPAPAIGDDEGGEVSAYLKRLMGRRRANEQVRLLYVAATRAKRTLQFSASPKLKEDGTPWSGTLLECLWQAIQPIAQVCWDTAHPSEPASKVPAAPQLRRLVPDWSLPVLASTTDLPHLPVARQSLQPPEFSWVGETARHIGTVVHAALESFASLGALPAEAEIEGQRAHYAYQLRRHGVDGRELERAANIVVQALTRTVMDERGRWIFATGHKDAHSEWALTGLAAGRLTNVVIDRSFVDRSGTRWVIDFKTSRHEGGGLEEFLEQEMDRYRAQLQTYVALARGMGIAPVRAGLYFPLLGVFREPPDTGQGDT